MMRTIQLLTFLVLASSLSTAQDTIVNLPSDQVEVVKNYEAIILQAIKKDIPVQQRDVEHQPISFFYTKKTPKLIEFDRPDPQIQALSYNVQNKRTTDIKDGNFYGSYGNLNTIAAGGAYHYYIEDWIEAGFKADHFSANDKSLDFQKLSTTNADIYAGYYFTPRTKLKLGGHASFDRHRTDGPDIIDSLFTEQKFDKFGGNLAFSHTSFEALGVVFRSYVSFDNLKQIDDEVDQNTLSATASLLKTINNNLSIEIPFEYRRLNFTADVFEANVNDIQIKPRIRVKNEKYNGHLGIHYINGSNFSSILPNAQISIPELFAEIDLFLLVLSEFQRNELEALSDLNPYYHTLSTPLTPNLVKKYGLKFRRNFDKATITFKSALIHQDSMVNFHFVESSKRFQADHINLKTIQFDLGLAYQINSNNKVQVNVIRRNFLDEVIPYYLANWELEFSIQNATSDNKLITELGFNYLGKRQFSESEVTGFEGLSLKAFGDLWADIEYKLNPSIGLFAKASNILNTDGAAIWLGHPVLGPQVWGGLRFNL